MMITRMTFAVVVGLTLVACGEHDGRPGDDDDDAVAQADTNALETDDVPSDEPEGPPQDACGGFGGGGFEGFDGGPDEAQGALDERMGSFLDRINATEEQRAAAEDIRDEFVTAAMPFIGQAMQGRESLRAAWEQEQPDGEAMHAAVDTIGTSITGIAHLVVDAALTFRGLLTEEQLAQLRDDDDEDEERPDFGPPQP